MGVDSGNRGGVGQGSKETLKLSQVFGSFRSSGGKRSRTEEKVSGNKRGFLPEIPSGRVDAVDKGG